MKRQGLEAGCQSVWSLFPCHLLELICMNALERQNTAVSPENSKGTVLSCCFFVAIMIKMMFKISKSKSPARSTRRKQNNFKHHFTQKIHRSKYLMEWDLNNRFVPCYLQWKKLVAPNKLESSRTGQYLIILN